MKKQYKYRTFFGNKQCNYCKQIATTMRFYNGRSYILCDSKLCDYKNRIATGIFKTAINIKG